MKQDKTLLVVPGVIAIVAVLGMFFMFNETVTKTTSDDVTGQVVASQQNVVGDYIYCYRDENTNVEGACARRILVPAWRSRCPYLYPQSSTSLPLCSYNR